MQIVRGKVWRLHDWRGNSEMANVALSVVGNTNHIKCERNIYKNTTHSCKDGSYGFADFQGFRKMEE